jgi:peptidylprolyl isomerase
MREVLLKARDGDIVRVNYVLSLKYGPVFSPSTEPLPFEVMIGRGTVLPAFENAVIDMREGEAKKITVPVEKSFACYFDEFIKVIERRTLPLDINPEVG